MIVVMLVLRLVSFIGIPGMIARIIALIAVILTGVLREVYNKKHVGNYRRVGRFERRIVPYCSIVWIFPKRIAGNGVQENRRS